MSRKSFCLSILTLASCISAATSGASPPRKDEATLRMTAIVGKNGISTAECWSLVPGFVISTQPGDIGAKQIQLGQVANISYTELPSPGPFFAGLHNAPNPQYVVVLSGEGRVTFPETKEVLILSAGQTIIAVDTPGTSILGHNTTWQGGSRALQIPFEPGFFPNHTATSGQCH